MKTNCRRSSTNHAARLPGATIPAWQTERENRLHRQFKRVETAMQQGQSLNAALRQFQYFWRGKTYRSEPSRPVRWSLSTLIRLYYQWKHGGCISSALRIAQPQPGVSSPVVIRFVQHCASRHWPSYQKAWTSFVGTWAFQCGRKGARSCSFWRMRLYFPVVVFRAIQETHTTEAAARLSRGQLIAQAIAEIRRVLPDRPPKRIRRTGAELSLQGAQL